MRTVSVWDFLESEGETAPAVADLYSWGLNCDRSSNPFLLFLDLMGWSAENLGEPLAENNDRSGYGFLELDYLAKALTEYADNPDTVRRWVARLMECDGV